MGEHARYAGRDEVVLGRERGNAISGRPALQSQNSILGASLEEEERCPAGAVPNQVRGQATVESGDGMGRPRQFANDGDRGQSWRGGALATVYWLGVSFVDDGDGGGEARAGRDILCMRVLTISRG